MPLKQTNKANTMSQAISLSNQDYLLAILYIAKERAKDLTENQILALVQRLRLDGFDIGYEAMFEARMKADIRSVRALGLVELGPPQKEPTNHLNGAGVEVAQKLLHLVPEKEQQMIRKMLSQSGSLLYQ